MTEFMASHKAVSVAVICLIITLIIAALFSFAVHRFNNRIVGENINTGEITSFLYTIKSTTNPPEYLSYRFYNNDGKYPLHYEATCQNDNTAGDFTATTEDIELNEVQWLQMTELLTGGIVTKRKENTESGSRGPWMYLYYGNDKNKYVEFNFGSYEKRVSFENFCSQLISQQNFI